MDVTVSLSALLNLVSSLSTPFIASMAAFHLVVFIFLIFWARRDVRVIASALDDFTRGLAHRSVLDRTAHVSDQIDAFIADVNDVLATPSRVGERALLLERMSLFDE